MTNAPESTLTPEEIAEAKRIRFRELWRERAIGLLRKIDVVDLAGVTPPGERIQYETKERSRIKVKGGAPPIDYSGVEALVDLSAEVREADPDTKVIIRNVVYLRSLFRL
jgi:hypothetical protein